MHLVYLMLAHHRPDLVGKLVHTLASHGSPSIYIHLDARVDPRPFEQATDGLARFVRRRVRAGWGSYNLVRATLNGLTDIVEGEADPFYLVTLSGQDFPVKPIPEIERFYATTPHAAHLDHSVMGSPEGHETKRYERFFIHNQWKVRGTFRLQGILHRLPHMRSFPAGFTAYSGSQWWSARHDVVRHVVRFVRENPKFRRFFLTTNIPDEMFFHTIIMNSVFAAQIANDDLRHIEWPEGSWSPRTLTEADLPRLLASPKLFARKFDDVDVTAELAHRLNDL